MDKNGDTANGMTAKNEVTTENILEVEMCQEEEVVQKGSNYKPKRGTKRLSISETEDWDEERRHYNGILKTYRSYRTNSRARIQSTEAFIKSLPKDHQTLLGDYSRHLNSLLVCFDVNQQIFDQMIDQENIFENYPDMNFDDDLPDPPSKPTEHVHRRLTDQDIDKCHVVLKQIVRDWSSEGQRERNLCYIPILEELDARFSDVKYKGVIRVLVPGAGLGRLTHEIVRRGYCTEGNEFSLFMLFASNFLLNRSSGKDHYKCFPWIHQHTNVLFHMDQTRSVSFPDIDPSDLPPNSKFSMTAGDFLEVYGKPEHEGAWDCLVTCFFIDCGKNIVTILERILYCLKENGIWINLGPLLYHFADMTKEGSIEPPYDFLAGIIRRIGFKIEKEILDLPTTYADNPRSMLSFTYKSVFLVCRKLQVPNVDKDYEK